MNKLKPWLVVLLVFLAGVVCGVVGTRAVVRHAVRAAVQKPEQIRQRIENRLASHLALTPEQRAQAHEILLAAQQEIQGLRAELQPRYLGIVDRAEAEIAALLTPEQRAEFEKLLVERKFLWRPKGDEARP